jgi:hypothetical protein
MVEREKVKTDREKSIYDFVLHVDQRVVSAQQTLAYSGPKKSFRPMSAHDTSYSSL